MVDTGPQPTGDLLCSISRPGYDGAADERLDIRWDTFNSKPFVSLRCWRRAADGIWYPLARKGLSVRLRELGDVITALKIAERRAAAQLQPGQHQSRERRPTRSLPGFPPTSDPSSGRFDELD